MLGPVVGAGSVRVRGEQQERSLVLFQPLPQVVAASFGDLTPLVVLAGRNRRQFLIALVVRREI